MPGAGPFPVCLGRLSRPCVGAGPAAAVRTCPRPGPACPPVVLCPPRGLTLPGFPAHGLSLHPRTAGGLLLSLVSFTGSYCYWRDPGQFSEDPGFSFCFSPLGISGHAGGLPGGTAAKTPPAMPETLAQPLGGEGPLEKRLAPHCSLAWRVPWTEEPGRLQFMGSHRFGPD